MSRPPHSSPNLTLSLILQNTVVAMAICSTTAFIAIISATLLRVILVRLNRKLDRGEPVEGAITTNGAVGVKGEVVPKEAAERGFRFLI